MNPMSNKTTSSLTVLLSLVCAMEWNLGVTSALEPSTTAAAVKQWSGSKPPVQKAPLSPDEDEDWTGNQGVPALRMERTEIISWAEQGSLKAAEWAYYNIPRDTPQAIENICTPTMYWLDVIERNLDKALAANRSPKEPADDKDIDPLGHYLHIVGSSYLFNGIRRSCGQPYSNQKGYALIQQGAERGDQESVELLAGLYFEGFPKRDPVEVYRWRVVALVIATRTNDGVASAEATAERAGEDLTPEQCSEGVQRASAWLDALRKRYPNKRIPPVPADFKRQETLPRQAAPTAAAKSLWTDVPAGSTFQMSDPYRDLAAVVDVLKKTPDRGEFEKTAEFEQRRLKFNAELDQLLKTPLVFRARRQISYDADKEVMGFVLYYTSHQREDKSWSALEQTDYPFVSLNLVVPTRWGTGTDGQGAVGVGFRMSPDEARQRKENLSLLYAVCARATDFTYVPGGAGSGRVTLEVKPESLELWLVDTVKKERLEIRRFAGSAEAAAAAKEKASADEKARLERERTAAERADRQARIGAMRGRWTIRMGGKDWSELYVQRLDLSGDKIVLGGTIVGREFPEYLGVSWRAIGALGDSFETSLAPDFPYVLRWNFTGEDKLEGTVQNLSTRRTTTVSGTKTVRF